MNIRKVENNNISFGIRIPTTKEARAFISNQSKHAKVQASLLLLAEFSGNPIHSIKDFFCRKTIIDLAEALFSTKEELNIAHKCTNAFAYLADGYRLIKKLKSR